MKKLALLTVLLFAAFSLTACGSDVDPRPDNLITFEHLDGYGTIVDRDLFVMFEYEMRDYVKYQIAYVACTCRAPEVNYWKVAYVEIGTENHELRKISFRNDGTGNYTAGFWGDSDPIPTTGHTLTDFENDFIPWLVGQNASDLDGISIFFDDTPPQYSAFANTKPINEPDLIDDYTGASVTTNNMIRAMKALLDYHEGKHAN